MHEKALKLVTSRNNFKLNTCNLGGNTFESIL